jgi:excisionase family DNA binding protein
MARAAVEPASPPPTYDIGDIAVALKVCHRTIRRMIDQGQVPGAFRLGGRIRFRATEVDRWIQDGCPRPRGR